MRHERRAVLRGDGGGECYLVVAVRNPAAQDGGLHYPGNSAGPAYGTGYCDAQCPHDIKWINGEANMEVRRVVEIVELQTNICEDFSITVSWTSA